MATPQAMVHTFSNPVALKLDEENYLPWKQQAEATIEGHDLLDHIIGKRIPRKFASKADQESEIVSTNYQHWKKQDAFMKSWLFASMSKPFTTRMVGCEFSHQIWKRLKMFFASQVTVKVRQLKHKLSNTRKEGSVSDYLLEIKKTVDALISVGAPIEESDQVAAILDGLTEEYAPFITSIISRPGTVSVGELEALLMAQEEMIERFRSREGNFQANLVHLNQQSKKFNSSQNNQGYGRGRGNFPSGKGGGRSRRGGRSSNRPVC